MVSAPTLTLVCFSVAQIQGMLGNSQIQTKNTIKKGEQSGPMPSCVVHTLLHPHISNTACVEQRRS